MENLMNTLDIETQLRHAKQAVKELQQENKELTEALKAIVAVTSDETLPLFKVVNHISFKSLKAIN